MYNATNSVLEKDGIEKMGSGLRTVVGCAMRVPLDNARPMSPVHVVHQLQRYTPAEGRIALSGHVQKRASDLGTKRPQSGNPLILEAGQWQLSLQLLQDMVCDHCRPDAFSSSKQLASQMSRP